MAATIKEFSAGYGGNNKSRRVDYLVRDAISETEAINLVVSTAAAYRDGLILSDAEAKELGGGLYKAAALYAESKKPPKPDVSSSTYTFSIQVESETYFFSENRLSRLPTNAPQVTNGRIGIEVDETQGRWSGITVPAGPITDEISYEYPQAVIPASYRNLVRSYAGAVNSDVFLSQPAGSMRLLRVSASVTAENRQTISFGFGNRPNRTSVAVGPYTIAAIDGWDFFWSLDKVKVLIQPTTLIETLAPEPEYVYVERLLPRKTFATLGIDL